MTNLHNYLKISESASKITNMGLYALNLVIIGSEMTEIRGGRRNSFCKFCLNFLTSCVTGLSIIALENKIVLIVKHYSHFHQTITILPMVMQMETEILNFNP